MKRIVIMLAVVCAFQLLDSTAFAKRSSFFSSGGYRTQWHQACCCPPSQESPSRYSQTSQI